MPVGSVIIADEQRAGIGRHGHVWNSPASAGLYLSVVLEQNPALTLALGVAAHAAIQKVTSLTCDIRWPNDLMLSDKKFGGILVQIHDSRAVAGIGINIAHHRFPPELEKIATSLFLETGLDFRHDDILSALLEQIPPVIARPVPEIIQAWESLSTWAHGKPVQVEMGNRTLTGITDGLDAAGFLRIRSSNGDVELVLAGGVRPLELQ